MPTKTHEFKFREYDDIKDRIRWVCSCGRNGEWRKFSSFTYFNSPNEWKNHLPGRRRVKN